MYSYWFSNSFRSFENVVPRFMGDNVKMNDLRCSTLLIRKACLYSTVYFEEIGKRPQVLPAILAFAISASASCLMATSNQLRLVRGCWHGQGFPSYHPGISSRNHYGQPQTFWLPYSISSMKNERNYFDVEGCTNSCSID
ncbi:hypothetical protein DIRU0_E28612 [Diutina rugosa]